MSIVNESTYMIKILKKNNLSNVNTEKYADLLMFRL